MLPKYQTVVFVHGCFWHRHANCVYTSTPSTRREFWQAKFDSNVRRDWRVQRMLRKDGWRVMIVWECQTSERKLKALVTRILR